MDTATVITTPARRIVRTLNGYSTGWRVWFDADGHKITACYDPERRTFAPHRDTWHTEWSTGRQPHTWRGVQDALDAKAWATANPDAEWGPEVVEDTYWTELTRAREAMSW